MNRKLCLQKPWFVAIAFIGSVACANEVDIRLGGLAREEALRNEHTDSKIRSELDRNKYATGKKSLDVFGSADMSSANELLFVNDLGSKKIEIYQGRCINPSEWTFANEEKWSAGDNAYENLCKRVRKFFGENEKWHVRTYAALCSRDFLKRFFFSDLLTDGSSFSIKLVVDIAKGYQYAWGGCAEIFVQVNEVLPNGQLGYGVDYSVTIKKTDRKTDETNCVDIMQITIWRTRNEKNQIDTILKDGCVVYQRKSLAEEQLAKEKAQKERQAAIEKAQNEKLLKDKRAARKEKAAPRKANKAIANKQAVSQQNAQKPAVADKAVSQKNVEAPVVEQPKPKFRLLHRSYYNSPANGNPKRGIFSLGRQN